MLIALFPNAHKKESKQLALSIIEFLSARGVTVLTEESEKLDTKHISSVSPNKIDFLLSMGGDGTILRLYHKYEKSHAAILGINLGHLGFMADIPLPDLYPSLQDLIDGKYHVEERIALDGQIASKERFSAVNDIVLHRGRNPSLVEMAIHVDGIYLNTFEADGVIVATPTGSTAYSLAAGGPILGPTLEAVVITPISPHTISNRPIVLTSEQKITIQYLSEFDPLEVRGDGLVHHELHTGDVLHIERSKKNFRLVNLHRRNYFSTLRSKLGWAGKLR